MPSKIKIQTSSRNKAQLALLRDEVRILIFDDPAENERGQRRKFCFTQLNSTAYYLSREVPKFSSYTYSSIFFKIFDAWLQGCVSIFRRFWKQ